MLNVEIISGKINNKAQKVVIYGPEGIGKSTFAAHFPNPLFIDTLPLTLEEIFIYELGGENYGLKEIIL